MRSGTHILATHGYKKNVSSPVGKELDLDQGDTLVYLREHDGNEEWWLTDDGKGQMGYEPEACHMIII